MASRREIERHVRGVHARGREVRMEKAVDENDLQDAPG
jgi:hypothetical protein